VSGDSCASCSSVVKFINGSKSVVLEIRWGFRSDRAFTSDQVVAIVSGEVNGVQIM
jgi:hypothetical protein